MIILRSQNKITGFLWRDRQAALTTTPEPDHHHDQIQNEGHFHPHGRHCLLRDRLLPGIREFHPPGEDHADV